MQQLFLLLFTNNFVATTIYEYILTYHEIAEEKFIEGEIEVSVTSNAEFIFFLIINAIK